MGNDKKALEADRCMDVVFRIITESLGNNLYGRKCSEYREIRYKDDIYDRYNTQNGRIQDMYVVYEGVKLHGLAKKRGIIMGDFEYTKPQNAHVSSKEIINDLKKVALENNTDILPQRLYKEYGKYDVTNISRRFGTWNKALLRAGLKTGNIINYPDEELFENILNIWQHKGKQPVRRDLNFEPSIISQYPYNRRFKSWSEALRCFVEYANENNDIVIKSSELKNITIKTNRDPSLRLRFQVLKRDKFTCVQCGASPAKDQSVELHVDHIKPWSKGGETIYENLQTLCLKCNLGKSNLE